MQYQSFDPTDCGFPMPKVPLLPALGWRSLGRTEGGQFKLLEQTSAARFFTRGRYALTEAYRLAGLGVGGALLAPSYHCRTMLDPAIRLGAAIEFYPLNADLSPDLYALDSRLSACQQSVKAMLVTHYFGFAQNLEPLADFCKQNHIALIEDCSHALIVASPLSAQQEKAVIGKTGQFGVGSPYKFFPSEDGGLLWVNAVAVQPCAPLRAQSFRQELKGMVHAAQRAMSKPPDWNVTPRDNEGTLHSAGRDVLEEASGTSPYYLSADEHRQGLASSRWIMRHTNIERLANRRREHYMQWVHAVAYLPHCRALYPQLPDCTVPYMFPLHVDCPDPHYFLLKRMGVPIWRWDDMAVSQCPVASRYRLQLLHLPCHQELAVDQMAWMVNAIRSVMLKQPARNE
jgi:hypothetical protein